MIQRRHPHGILQWLQGRGQVLCQIIDLRLALVVGLLTFLLAVGVDSAGNAAEAATLVNPAYPPGVVVTPVAPQPATAAVVSPGLDDQAVARRLHHGILTSAILTNNRLTEAHFFTDLPPGE